MKKKKKEIMKDPRQLKQKLMAALSMVIVAGVLLSTVTFAWLVMSIAPEVRGVTTNVGANGSLEIALATGDGKTAPGESKVGDSSAAEGQSIVNANKTWGNLINLNDEAYGLENLVLRPASLVVI